MNENQINVYSCTVRLMRTKLFVWGKVSRCEVIFANIADYDTYPEVFLKHVVLLKYPNILYNVQKMCI